MDKELISILQILLNSTLITSNTLQEETNSSKRQIAYRLEKINDMLKTKKVPPISFVAGKEIVVHKETKDAIKDLLEKNYSRNTYYFSKNERMLYMYLMLFINMEDLSLNHFIDSLKVSRSTVNLDYKDLVPELDSKGIYIKNNRTNGYYLTGSESEIRRLMIKNVIETLANGESSRVFDLFLEEYKLGNFNESREVILKLIKKYEITFVEDRLTEFIYIFLLLKARMVSDRESASEKIEMPNITIMNSMKEYKFTEELLETYESKDKIEILDVMYISAWILGSSVGNVDEETSDRYVVSEIVNKIMIKFEALSGIYFKNHTRIFNQIYSHFRPAYYRLLFKLPIVNPLWEKVKEEYNLVYKFVSNSMKEFYRLFGEEIQEEELAYLTLHFAAIFYNKKDYEVIEKKKALIVCSNGIGSSAILYTELTNLFPELHFFHPIEFSKAKDFKEHIDIVFTTNFKTDNFELDVPIIKVSPVMTQKEKYKVTREVYIQMGDLFLKQPRIEDVMDIIKKHANVISENMLANELISYFTQIENFTSKGDEELMLSDITNETLIKLRVPAKNLEDAIRQSASVLVENGKATQEYVDAMVNTAKESGAYIVITKHVALPHARPEAGTKEIAIGIATLENPIEFGNAENDPVKYVFCLSAVDNNSHLYAMSELVELLEMDEFFKTLDNAKDAKEIMDFIKSHES